MATKLLRVAVSIALLARVASRTDWEQVRAGFAGLRWDYWVAAVLLLGCAQIASAWRWKYYTDQLQLPRTLRQLTGFYFIGAYFNLLLPTSVGGDVIRAWYVAGPTGRRLAAFASVLLDRLNGLCVLVALACLAVTLSPVTLPPWITLSAWGVAAAGAVGLGGLHLFAGRDSTVALGAEASSSRMAQLRTTLRVLCLPSILPPTLLLSLCVQAANVLVVWLVGQAIGAPIPAAYYWVMVPMVTLLTLLPISVGGVGVREEATVLFLAPVGVAQGTALTLSVLWFAVTVGVSLVGGAVYLCGRFPKPVEEPGARDLGQESSMNFPRRPASLAPHGPHPSMKETTDGPVGGDSDQGRTRQHRQAA